MPFCAFCDITATRFHCLKEDRKTDAKGHCCRSYTETLYDLTSGMTAREAESSPLAIVAPNIML